MYGCLWIERRVEKGWPIKFTIMRVRQQLKWYKEHTLISLILIIAAESKV